MARERAREDRKRNLSSSRGPVKRNERVEIGQETRFREASDLYI